MSGLPWERTAARVGASGPGAADGGAGGDGGLLDAVRRRLAESGAEPTPARVAAALRAQGRLLGDAEVRESWDERAGCFRIRVTVTNRRFGPLFGYHGSFTAAYVRSGAPVPAAVRPLRENPA